MAKNKAEEFERLLTESAARESAAQRPPAAKRPAPRDSPIDRDTLMLDREKIEPNIDQPRRLFDQAALKSLGESLRSDGQQQALVVRDHPTKPGKYQIIAGERRWRASAPEYGDVKTLRCTVVYRDLSDEEIFQLALIENLHRTDLSTLEKARAIERLRLSPRGDKRTIRSLESITGIKKSQIDRLLSILKLPERIQERFEALELNEAHGRALVSLNDEPNAQRKLLRSIEAGEMSGNEAMRVAESLKTPEPPREKSESGGTSSPVSTSQGTGMDTGAGQTRGLDTSTKGSQEVEGSLEIEGSEKNQALDEPASTQEEEVSRETKSTSETPLQVPAGGNSERLAQARKYLQSALEIYEAEQEHRTAAKVRDVLDNLE